MSENGGELTQAGSQALKRFSVVIPVYYNTASLPPLFTELKQVEQSLLRMGLELELIFVDDGSKDSSLQGLLEIKAQRPATRVVKLTRNFGSFHACKAGMGFATGDCFTILTADLQDPPELLLAMAEKWLAGAKYVVCARRSREDPPISKLFSAIYYRLLRLMVVPDYPEGGFDVALMDRAMLPHILNSSKNVNISLFAYWLGFEPVILHYDRRKRQFGKSRWTFSKKLKLFLDSLLGFSMVPIRIISAIGVLISISSFGYGVVIMLAAILGTIEVPGFASLAALMAFLLGLIIIMLGVIGEYIWRIFDEVSKRPESVIDEVY